MIFAFSLPGTCTHTFSDPLHTCPPIETGPFGRLSPIMADGAVRYNDHGSSAILWNRASRKFLENLTVRQRKEDRSRSPWHLWLGFE